MQADEALRLDYDQTTQFVRTLIDMRIRLLAFVPTISGAAVGLLSDPRPAPELIGVALVGLVATVGIFLYELRNSQLYRSMTQRARELERVLDLPKVQGVQGVGGVLAARSGRWFAHDRGWGLVYAAAIGGWSYLAAWGFLAWMLVDSAQTFAALIGFAVGIAVAVGIELFEPGDG